MPWVDGNYVMGSQALPDSAVNKSSAECIDPLCDECAPKRRRISAKDAASTAKDVALCEATYSSFLSHLASLISRRTVVTDDDAVDTAIEFCRAEFCRLLSPLGWTVEFDAVGNLRCTPPFVDTSRPVLYLNAHIDTVDAAKSDFGGHDPFTCRETATHLIGRGANDCKAGVAFMLWYSKGLSARELPRFNGGFLITRREEAGSSRPRTASQFALDLASNALPMSTLPRSTFVCCLENTVSLAAHLKASAPEVAIYNQERHSFVLVCRGTLPALGRALLSLKDHDEWKTVTAWPLAAGCGDGDAAAEAFGRRRLEPAEALDSLGCAADSLVVHAQEGGHACTVRNLQTHVYRILVREAAAASAEASEVGGDALGLDATMLSPAGLVAWVQTRSASPLPQSSAAGAGDEARIALMWSGVASQPTRVATSVTSLPRAALRIPPKDDWEHALILNYRGLKPISEVSASIDQLRAALGNEGVQWGAGTDLASGEGSQQAAFVSGSTLPSALEALVARLDGAVTLKYEANPGRSDASHLWRSLPDDLKGERVLPFTCGPGHRSHRCQANV